MNPERRIRLPIDDITEKTVSNACWNLANAITGRRWSSEGQRRTALSRSSYESLAFLANDEKILYEDDYDTADTSTVVDFHAAKIGGGFERYQLIHRQALRVEFPLLPRPLLERILQENNGDEEAASSYFEGMVIEDLVDDAESFVGHHVIDQYLIDEDGDILTYDLTNMYMAADGETSLTEEAFSYTFGPIASDTVRIGNEGGMGARAHERHHAFLHPLTERRIQLESQAIQQRWHDSIQLYEEIDPSVSVAGVGLGEHYRRIIALLAMTGQGIVSVDQLVKERHYGR